MTKPSDLIGIHESLLEIESELSLFERTIDGVAYWERVRFEIFKYFYSECGVLGQAHGDIGNSWSDRMKGVYLWMRNLVWRNPYFESEHECIFYGHPRRKLGSDGTWWDIYSDPVLDALDLDALYVEYDHELEHKTPTRTDSVHYTDFVNYSGTLYRTFSKYSIPTEERRFLEQVADRFEEMLDVPVDVAGRVRDELADRRVTFPLYRRMLSRIAPEFAVLVVSYGKESFIEACQQLDIPVIELQHGVVTRYHYGYSFPGNRRKRVFPDYFFSFGPFWHEQVPFPLPDKKVYDVGYPYLEQEHKKLDGSSPPGDNIVFVSQGTIGDRLSQFAVEVESLVPESHDVIYKLHPGEYSRWQEEYPWLVEADLTVIDEQGPSLYQLFADASVQVGVYSTAVFEGLSFGLDTYVVDLPGAEYLADIVEDGVAQRVESATEFVEILGTHEKRTYDTSRYFVQNSLENITEGLDSVQS